MSNADFGRLLAGLIVQNMVFIGLTLWWMRREGRTLADIGLARPAWRLVLLGIGGGLVVAAAGHWLGDLEIHLLQEMLAPETFQRLQWFTAAYGAERVFQQLSAPWMMAAFALVGSLLAPLAEEMLFRGVVFQGLRTKWRMGTGNAIVGSSLLFALAHASPLALLPLFCMGVAFALLYVRTGSLWVPITMHLTNNVVNFCIVDKDAYVKTRYEPRPNSMSCE